MAAGLATPSRRLSQIAKLLHGPGHSRADHVLAFRRIHRQFLVAVDDRAGLEQDGRHSGPSKHYEMIVPIDTRILVQQFSSVSPHERLRILAGILQALGLHLLADQPAEHQAGVELRILAGNEQGIAAEPVAEMALRAFKFPFFEKGIRYGVMMDRQEKSCS